MTAWSVTKINDTRYYYLCSIIIVFSLDVDAAFVFSFIIIDFCGARVTQRDHVCSRFISFYEQYLEYDPALTVQEPSNPWISDNTELWDLEKSG